MDELGKINYEAFWLAAGAEPEPAEYGTLPESARNGWASGAAAVAREVLATATAPESQGQWMHIGFFGRIELTGYVTEITVGGQPVFHIDLPDKIWGSNSLAWEEYAASALHNRRPLTEETVRSQWEAAHELARRRAAQQAEWDRQQRQYALEAAETQPGDDEDDSYDDEQSTAELADEAMGTAMSASERDEYDRDCEAWLDAADEARDLEREHEDRRAG